MYNDHSFIERWSTIECENECCEDCNNYDNCYESAVDAYDAQIIFHDMVISGGYDSEEDFWECNGI